MAYSAATGIFSPLRLLKPKDFIYSGYHSNNVPVQFIKFNTALHAKKKEQREIKKICIYWHESPDWTDVQSEDYRNISAVRWKCLFCWYPVTTSIIIIRNVETDFNTPLFCKKRFAENGRLLFFCHSFLSTSFRQVGQAFYGCHAERTVQHAWLHSCWHTRPMNGIFHTSSAYGDRWNNNCSLRKIFNQPRDFLISAKHISK